MYNRIEPVLEQYPFVVDQIHKGREAFLCDTSQGLKIIKAYKGSEARADFLYKMLLFLKENGHKQVDCIVKTKEDRTIVVDIDETTYMVRDWWEGRECDTKNREDVLKSVTALAELHQSLRLYAEEIPDFLKSSPRALLEEYQKHWREIKKVKNYINGKKKKNDFEIKFIKSCNTFLNQAEQVMDLQKQELLKISQEKNGDLYGICHGDFNHHNVLFNKEGTSILNYEKVAYGIQVSDLSNFMRKILEKHNWNLGLGMDMLQAYNNVRRLEPAEMRQLYIRLAYPEKYWKVSNHYYNNSKTWVCGRDIEKLVKTIDQNEAKEHFLQIMSCNLLF